jgi:hypothetical protein
MQYRVVQTVSLKVDVHEARGTMEGFCNENHADQKVQRYKQALESGSGPRALAWRPVAGKTGSRAQFNFYLFGHLSLNEVLITSKNAEHNENRTRYEVTDRRIRDAARK